MRNLKFILFVCSISGLLFGFDAGIISGAMIYLKNDFHLTPLAEGIIVSGVPIGALVSAVLSGRVIDYFGRKKALVITGLLFLTGSIFCTIGMNIDWIIIGRLFMGLGVGLSSTITPLYLSELSPAQHRGKIVTYYLISVNAGIFLCYVSNALLAGFESWQLMFLITAIPAIIFTLCLKVLPESPRWLYTKGREAQANRVIKELYSIVDQNTELEFVRKNKHVQVTKLSKLTWTHKRLLLIGIAIGIFTQAVGINAVIYYAPTILMDAGFRNGNIAIFASIFIGFAVMFAAIIASRKLDKLGRRRMLLTGLVGIITCLVLMSASYALINNPIILASVILILSVIFVLCQGLSVGPACFLLPAEIFPIDIRGLGMSLSIAANWFTNIIVAMFFPTMISLLGTSATFLTFAIISIIGFIFFTYCITETKQKSLEEITQGGEILVHV
ncbi:sugar porter family MFS transporter [Fastidiosibacter lacustris]|uniref:sugar porter family MFS transporter n=1 Tax=Fastidiosibacter lacustris TaxID=2056695 RepID=UPI000E34A0E9|nr:sugar porter family MFS transporter [Fastidiosibacter lacustris]